MAPGELMSARERKTHTMIDEKYFYYPTYLMGLRRKLP
jgi:hypothetical protein